MQTPAWTPSPWEVRQDWYIHRVGGSGGSFAEVKCCFDVPVDRKDEHRANALLMAAAPELYAACLVARNYGSQGETPSGVSVSYLLDEAMAKARGERSS